MRTCTPEDLRQGWLPVDGFVCAYDRRTNPYACRTCKLLCKERCEIMGQAYTLQRPDLICEDCPCTPLFKEIYVDDNSYMRGCGKPLDLPDPKDALYMPDPDTQYGLEEFTSHRRVSRGLVENELLLSNVGSANNSASKSASKKKGARKDLPFYPGKMAAIWPAGKRPKAPGIDKAMANDSDGARGKRSFWQEPIVWALTELGGRGSYADIARVLQAKRPELVEGPGKATFQASIRCWCGRHLKAVQKGTVQPIIARDPDAPDVWVLRGYRKPAKHKGASGNAICKEWIVDAFKKAPSLTLTDIYDYIARTYPDAVNLKATWKNTVRTNVQRLIKHGQLRADGGKLVWVG